MGINRENGYSASVEGFLVVNNSRFRLAKTNGIHFVLAEPSCELPPKTDADLVIIVDSTTASKRVTLPDGVMLGQRLVKYEEVVPF
jgi:hypothetical protein